MDMNQSNDGCGMDTLVYHSGLPGCLRSVLWIILPQSLLFCP